MDGIIAAVYYLFKSVQEFQSTKNKKVISFTFRGDRVLFWLSVPLLVAVHVQPSPCPDARMRRKRRTRNVLLPSQVPWLCGLGPSASST